MAARCSCMRDIFTFAVRLKSCAATCTVLRPDDCVGDLLGSRAGECAMRLLTSSRAVTVRRRAASET